MFTTHFYGNEISPYGRKYGYVDYRCFAKAFQGVINNDLIPMLSEKGFCFDLVSGVCEKEIPQYYIVDENGARLIREYTDDPLFWCEDLDMYVWGVTHYGTAWDYVLTDIECKKED